MKRNELTIIIPTLNTDRNKYALNECLKSLRASHFPMENVIVVYNGLGLNEEIEFDTSCETMTLSKQGQCAAVNAAVASVNTKYIMVTNDDMIYPKKWFSKLTNEFPENERCSVSPILVEPIDGAPTFIKYPCGGVGGDWDARKFMDFVNEYVGSGLRSGFNLPFLIKKELFDLVGGYDVAYDPWGSNSDSDLEYKLKLAGIKMYQNTDCPVYHFSQTSGTFHPSNQGYWNKNWDYFISKWGFPRTDNGIWEATFKIPYESLNFKPKWMVLPQEE